MSQEIPRGCESVYNGGITLPRIDIQYSILIFDDV